MTTLDQVRDILRDALSLGNRAERLNADSPLLGVIPEFDSMAVVTVLTMLEDQFGFAVEDDEVSADVFQTMGALVEFVERKLGA
jgi:acyl carrier protein